MAKVTVESESMIKSVMIDQSKTGAIDKAKVFVVVSHKYCLGGFLNCFIDMENFDAAFVESFHELDGGSVTDSEANDRDRFREDKIGC